MLIDLIVLICLVCCTLYHLNRCLVVVFEINNYLMLCAVGPPVWLHTVDEEIYEPLGTSTSLLLPQDMALCEDSSTRDIGDWGEQLVNNYLQAVQVRARQLCYHLALIDALHDCAICALFTDNRHNTTGTRSGKPLPRPLSTQNSY